MIMKKKPNIKVKILNKKKTIHIIQIIKIIHIVIIKILINQINIILINII